MTNEGNNVNELLRRMDVMIALLATIATKDENVTVRDKILMLYGFGLKAGEIASVLGKNSSYIRKELSVARSKK